MTRPRDHRQGLDQLGPTRAAMETDGIPTELRELNKRRRGPQSITERVVRGQTQRKPKVTLPKLNCLEDRET